VTSRIFVALAHGGAFFLGFGVLGLGCQSGERSIESSVAYEAPVAHRIVVESVVDLPADQAWDDLIRRLSESSFRVATLEKASRFVSIELQRSSDLVSRANRPSRYVDCGRTTRTFSEDGFDQHFEYAVADSSHHRESNERPEARSIYSRKESVAPVSL
jgi:hypothetical protein